MDVLDIIFEIPDLIKKLLKNKIKNNEKLILLYIYRNGGKIDTNNIEINHIIGFFDKMNIDGNTISQQEDLQDILNKLETKKCVEKNALIYSLTEKGREEAQKYVS